MDQETETPLDDLESLQEGEDAEEFVARSSGGGIASKGGGPAGSIVTQCVPGEHRECVMDQETEAPLDDLESVQDNDAEDELVARSSSGGSIAGSVAGSGIQPAQGKVGCGMDQEAEAPLDDLESVQDDDPDDEYLGRSSSGGSRVGSVAGSIATQPRADLYRERVMDQEAEAPLDDVESGQDDNPDDEYLGRSSSGGSIAGSIAGSNVT